MKKLVISPHIDDEILGCGGILDKKSLVLHCGVEDRSYVSAKKRLEEINEVKKASGFKMKLLKNKVNSYKETDLISDFEKTINDFNPDIAFIPYPSYNQDHREVYNASMVALRPHDQNFFVKKVVIYEQPHTFFWSKNKISDFNPSYFVPIDIEKKLKLYSLLKSQIRSFRSLDHVRSLAALRGGQCNHKFAEAFEILRWIV